MQTSEEINPNRMQKKLRKKMLKKYIHKKNQTTSYNRKKKQQ